MVLGCSHDHPPGVVGAEDLECDEVGDEHLVGPVLQREHRRARRWLPGDQAAVGIGLFKIGQDARGVGDDGPAVLQHGDLSLPRGVSRLLPRERVDLDGVVVEPLPFESPADFRTIRRENELIEDTRPHGGSVYAVRTEPGIHAVRMDMRSMSPASLQPAAASSPYRFVTEWGLGWAFVGALVAGGIAFTLETLDPLLPLVAISVLFAEVVGFTALTSARLIFPFFVGLPFAVRIGVQAVTLFSGTVFGSVMILATMPLFSLARPRTVAVVVLINASLAVVVGIALHTYESMRRQIEGSFRTLREKE